MTTRHWLAAVVLLIASSAAQGQPDKPPTDAAVAEQAARLDPRHDKAARLTALRWLQANGRHKNAALAVKALERCVRFDPEQEVRQEAIRALCSVARGLDNPCPLVVVEALHDKEDCVRYQVVESTAGFKSFAPGSTEVLFHGVKAENAELRSGSLLLLARAAPTDAKALAAIEAGKKDTTFDVRHSAHVALFVAKDKLADHLLYLIAVREDPATVLSPVPENSTQGKLERTQRNLLQLGIALRMIEWSETRADELADALFKLLGDRSVVVRRGAANLVGATAVKIELPPKPDGPLQFPTDPQGGRLKTLLPLLDPEAEVKPADAPQKSKVALRLEKLGVEAALRKLRDDDPDRTVRDAATFALKRLASVNEKKP